MIISLPNQLTGFVSCDRISPLLAEKFATASSGSSAEIPILSEYYQSGEVVVAAIVAVESPKTGGKRRRVELSLRPEHVNKGLESELFVAGLIVAGEIKSHEDRGYTISFGLKGKNDEFVGFLPDANTFVPLKTGKTVAFLVTSAFENRANRVVTLTIDHKTIAETFVKSVTDVSGLRCGTLVNAQVKGNKNGKLVVSFAGYEGRIDVLNLPDNVTLKRHKELDLSEHFPVGKNITARIAHCDLEEKRFLLAAHSGLIQWSPKIENDRVGERIEAATVFRIDAGLGVVISIGEGSFAYVHLSRLSDERVEKIEGQYKVGSKHAARLVDYDAFSGLYQASLQPSILKEALLRIQDVHPGQIVRGEVSKVESFGVIVSLTDRIRAICPKFQLTEVQTEQAVKSYHVGQKYKFRVLDCDTKTRRITLTRKKGLLDSTLSPLTDFVNAQVGNMHDGYIAAIKNFGCIVRFYGDVKGIVTVAEMTDDYVDKPQESFFVGQVVRCRIVKCDPTAKELTLSFRKQSGPKTRPDGVIQKRSARSETGEKPIKKSKPEVTLDDMVTA